MYLFDYIIKLIKQIKDTMPNSLHKLNIILQKFQIQNHQESGVRINNYN